MALTGDVGFSEAELRTLLKNIDQLTHDEAEEVEAMVSDLQARSARQAAYDDLIAFCKYMQPDYKVGRHHRILADQLMALDNGAKDRVAVNMPPRHGKLVADSTPVLTPAGWRTHGELQVGDYVFHPSGEPVEVLAVSDTAPADYEVEFTNGDTIRCHGAHEWTVYSRSKRVWETQETQWFLEPSRVGPTAGQPRNLTNGNRFQYQLPEITPLEFPVAELPLDPYFLGVWLGDGRATHPDFVYHPDYPQPRAELQRRGFRVTWEAVHKDTGVISAGFCYQGIKQALRHVGVLGNKHIPDIYIRASLEQRLDLLAGLIDTDGHVERSTGRVRIATCSAPLKDSLLEMLTGLGQAPYMYEQPPTTSTSGIVGRQVVYYVGFQPTIDIPVHIPHKHIKRLAPQRRKAIAAIRLNPNGEVGHCIQVDSPDGLYLVGRNLTPTHNSQLVSIYYPAWYIGRNPGKKVMMVSHTSDLAVDFGRKVRNLMNDTRYQEIFAGITLAQDSKSAGRWSTNHGSEYYATGVGSSLAGRGADMLIIDDPHALEINTPIPTPNGFVAIQDLKEGDFVFGPDGEPVKVLAKSEVWHDRELYSVTTDDGEEVLCDAQHLWGVNSDTNLGKAKVYNFTAEYLSNWPKANRPVIPRHQPVQYPARSLPIDPWVLGAWLGDGTTSGGRMTACPADQPYMLAEFAKAGYKTSPLTKDGFTFTAYGLMPQLRTLGVLNNKHIPEEYMVASTEQRMALLQGLIDTDGFVAASGQAGFYNCNLRLVTQVKELLHSLGVKCAVRTYLDTRGRHATSQPNHRVMFRLADCARMPRKLKYTRTPTDKRSRSIEVENTGGRGSVQCITVDRADGLFLAGRGYVVTHNSEQDVLAGNFEVFDKAYQWFTFGARTRLMPGGCVALVQTRWHLDDLSGRVVRDMTQNENADQYEVVEFPAIMEIKQPDGTIKERALWPAFFDLTALRRTQASMPTFQWNAQYQQDPTAEGSALIKRDWWRIWTETEPPEVDYVIMALDAAAEQKEQADYTAITTWGVFFHEEDRTNNLILLDAVRRRVEYPELRALAKEMYDKWEPDAFIVEKKSSGVALFQELRRTGMMLQEFTPHRGTGNKFARMQAVADIVKAGIVWVPTTRWAEELVEEIASFPVGAHDDLADTAVMALTRFRQGGFIRLPTDEEEDEAEYVPKRAAYY